MYYADSEVRDVLYFGVVLFTIIYFDFSCLYLRVCHAILLHCVFSLCLRSVIIVVVIAYFVKYYYE